MIFADTSVLIDFLSGEEKRVNEIEKLFREFEKKRQRLFLPQEVVVELVYYLYGSVKWDRAAVREVVSTIVLDRLFSVENRDVILEALNIFEASDLSFMDSLKVAKLYKRGVKRVLSNNDKLAQEELEIIKP